jgi:CheY-like chemotaxis protein
LALRELGYATIQAPSGAQALEILEAQPQVSRLLTDVVMPEMTGRQLADAALEMRADLKILFMTGYARNELTYNGAREADVNVLAKPFTLDQLGRKLREILG